MSRAYYEASARLYDAEAEAARLDVDVLRLDPSIQDSNMRLVLIEKAKDRQNACERQARAYREMLLDVRL